MSEDRENEFRQLLYRCSISVETCQKPTVVRSTGTFPEAY